jgi:RNA polymerase sigma-70 factor (ECF subfamily)
MVGAMGKPDPDKTDEQLLGEFLDGRTAALGELALRYEVPLLGLACSVLGGRRDLACDAVQETWLRVIRFAGRFTGRSGFKTWLYRIGLNQCRSLQAERLAPCLNADAAGPVDDRRPDRAAQAADENHALRSAVGRLDEDRRLVVLLCYHAEMTHAQAAEILDVPLGTLKSRLHSALTDLRTMLGAEVTP